MKLNQLTRKQVAGIAMVGVVVVSVMAVAPSVLAQTEDGTNNGESDATTQSTFDTDDDGWTVKGDSEAVEPIYSSNGGNPGGYVSAEDSVTGGVYYWNASTKFLGDRSDSYEGTLSFDLKQSTTDNQFDDDDVLLISGDTTLAYDFGNSSTHPGTNWTSYNLALQPSAGWVNAGSGENATESEMQAVLGNLNQLQIRGEYHNGADTGSLDNVVMSGPPTEKTTTTTTETTTEEPTEEPTTTETATPTATATATATATPTPTTKPASGVSPTEIDSCTEIEESGRYVLTADIENSTTDQCITVSYAHDVVVDGAGHTVDGVDDFPTSGIVVFGRSGANNVTVTNVTVSDWGSGIAYETTTGTIHDSVVASNSRGISFTFGTSGVLVANTTARGNDFDGLYLQNAPDNRFVNDTASDNARAYTSVSDPIEGQSVNNTVRNLELDSAAVSFESKDIELGGVETPPADPTDHTNIGQYVDATPSDEGNDSYLAVDVGYSDGDVASANVNESTLRFFAFADGEWSPVESSVNTTANTVSANVTEFANGSVFAPLGETEDNGNGARNASVTFDNQTSDGTTVTVDSVTVPDGGFVAIHNASLLDGDALGSVVGVSESLSPGTHENVEVTLFDVPGQGFAEGMALEENQTLIAMPHFDTNSNDEYDFVTSNASEDGAYTQNGSAVVDPAFVTVENESNAEPAYYQVDFVAGDPIENLRGEEGTYSNDQLIRFAHGSTEKPVMRLSDGEFTTDDGLADRIDSQNITVENGTATTTFTVNEGDSVTLSLVSYTKPGPGWSPETESQQEFVDAETRTFDSGTHTLTVDLPEEETNTTD